MSDINSPERTQALPFDHPSQAAERLRGSGYVPLYPAVAAAASAGARASGRRQADKRAECSHIAEAHVVFDRAPARWRAMFRCRCGEVTVAGEGLWERYIDAADEAKRLANASGSSSWRC